MRHKICLIFIILFAGLTAFAQANHDYSNAVDGYFTIHNFPFQSHETALPLLKIHYTTLGKPIKDKSGKVTNAVLIMHGTGSSNRGFLTQQFAGILFGSGQLLDTAKYYIILPDGIGHGKSSKPSDGLHMKFPKYTYDDMVAVYYRLLTEHLGVNHLRLTMGTSMGGMQTWMFGYLYPGFSDALLPLASLPVPIAGRNRMMRKMAINLIEADPEWKGGDYTSPPAQGLMGAGSSLFFMGSSPLQLQKESPSRQQSDMMAYEMQKGYTKMDANDLIYQLDASRNYDPSPYLDQIKAPLFAINSADDQINPPELGIMEREIKKVAKGRYILLPITDQTRGHGTNSLPAIWDNYLKELLSVSGQ
ncbi:alpha/beta fold hydrolase [Pedobacter sp. L105]|uniref:alpha/beta fold hydrolase n=1 Tax=Pedobacter sp. L105 TaxID=1641871 RepID=UPI00131BA4BA|nr:alpha/beta fold hydrolase [Pedobacter sp. L105]